MKTLLVASLCFLLFAATVASGQAVAPEPPKFENWIDYLPGDDSFSIKFPQRPTVAKIQNSNSPDTPSTQLLAGDGLGRGFELVYADLKGRLESSVFAKAGAVSAVVNVSKKHGGELLDRQSVTRGNCAGEQASLHEPHPATGKVRLLKFRVFTSQQFVFVVSFYVNSVGPDEAVIADRFLDSFALKGGCVETLALGPELSNKRSIVGGTLDKATGWRKIDAKYGISFLVPGKAELESARQRSGSSIYDSDTYTFTGAEHVFVLVITGDDGTKAQPKIKDQEAVLDGAEALLKNLLAAEELAVRDCHAVKLGEVGGRECNLAASDGEMAGKSRLFVIANRLLFATVMNVVPDADPKAIERFFSSIKRNPNRP